MTLGKTFLKSTSVLGLVVALSQPAFAMTCVEYNKMDEAGQMEAFEGMGGREMLRDEAVGADEDAQADAASETNALGDPDDDLGGRAAARAKATGSDEPSVFPPRTFPSTPNGPYRPMASMRCAWTSAKSPSPV